MLGFLLRFTLSSRWKCGNCSSILLIPTWLQSLKQLMEYEFMKLNNCTTLLMNSHPYSNVCEVIWVMLWVQSLYFIFLSPWHHIVGTFLYCWDVDHKQIILVFVNSTTCVSVIFSCTLVMLYFSIFWSWWKCQEWSQNLEYSLSKFSLGLRFAVVCNDFLILLWIWFLENIIFNLQITEFKKNLHTVNSACEEVLCLWI